MYQGCSFDIIVRSHNLIALLSGLDISVRNTCMNEFRITGHTIGLGQNIFHRFFNCFSNLISMRSPDLDISYRRSTHTAVDAIGLFVRDLDAKFLFPIYLVSARSLYALGVIPLR